MSYRPRNLFVFSMLWAACLGGCGGGTATSTADNSTIAFPAPGTDAPAATPDVTSLGECGALPGEWMFQDLITGAKISMSPFLPSTFQKNFRKSWGGATTAQAIWEFQTGDLPVWNEGRLLHVGSDTPLTADGMISSIALTGASDAMTALIGTDRGLVIADLTKANDKWTLSKQTVVEAMGDVRSVASNKLILEKNGEYIQMVYLVAQDMVMVVRLNDLRAGFGCVEVAYRAKDQPVDPKDPANKRMYRPIKVVAQHSYAAFLTASRPPEEFANAAQLQTLLQDEWLTFQSTAHLIDLTRKNPVMPFIMTMGKFDRFFASDIAASAAGIFLYGSRYTTANPSAVESGIASYEQFTGTPLMAIWAAVPKNFGGDFRAGRFDTNLANAYIRGLDRAAKVEGFLSGPTQQKWSAWKTPLTLDYVRGVNFRLVGSGELALEVPRYSPNGPLILNWKTATATQTTYVATTTLINATATDVDFLDAQGNVVHQHVQDDGKAVFPLFEVGDTGDTANTPRMFHTGELIFYVRHGANGPVVRVFKDSIMDSVNISESGPALLGFRVGTVGSDTANSPMSQKKVAVFGNMNDSQASQRIDDIREVSNPGLGSLRHFVALIHNWNGKTNNYRAVVLQMNTSHNKMQNRSIEIQGCSDLVDPGNNYSGNVSFGKPDDQPRFLGPLTAAQGLNGSITYSGYFQHFSPTYNVWSIKIDVTPEVVPGSSTCKPAGEMVPFTDSSLSESLSAVLSGNAILGLHSNGQIRWKIDANTTQYLDVGNNFLGGPVTVQKGKIVPAGSQFITQLETSDGFHPTALLSLDGSSGESCPACQFTDIASTGTLIFTANPERGAEFFEFK